MQKQCLPLKGSVQDNLLGVVMKNPNLAILTNSKTVVRSDHESLSRAVKILSGGGSGHEPAQAGYVGKGLLTASVSGEVFASPSSSEVFQSIYEIGKNHEPGVLLIILNYTGDRLNFGLAMERARHHDIKIEMCVVNDDCAISDCKPTVGRRGLAGSVLINKIAGALADKELELKAISSLINSILDKRLIKTIGISVNNGIVELGKGVHGEPGAMFLKLDENDYANMINEMLKRLFENFPYNSKDNIIVLINNLGGYSPCQELAIRNEVMKQLRNTFNVVTSGRTVRIYCGKYLTSLNVTGFSITIMLADDFLIECIDHKSVTDAWKDHFITLDEDGSKDMFMDIKNFVEEKNYECFGPRLNMKGSKILHRCLKYLCEALVSCKNQLDKIDSEAGDGDTGTTIACGAMEILNLLEAKKINTENPGVTFCQISNVAENFMGGTSGALYSIFFQAASSCFRTDCVEIDFSSWVNALCAGNRAIQMYGLSQKGDRTMLDPLLALQQSLDDSNKNGVPNFKALEMATEAAEREAQLTTEMIPQAGRAAYSCESIKTCYPDSGAHAVGIWMRAICEATRSLKNGEDFI